MKFRNTLAWLALAVLIGCAEQAATPAATQNSIETAVRQLSDSQAKKAFLEQILLDDQAVRNGQQEADIILHHGQDSDQYKAYIQAQQKQDELNLQKIESYLYTHGYPNRDEIGIEAALAPWIVLQHATDIEVRKRNFKTFYRAFLEGKVDYTPMLLYLQQTHELIFGQPLVVDSANSTEDEIIQLIKKMGL